MKPAKVSKAEYDRVVKENKELLDDIRVMACAEAFEAIQMRMKWRKIFAKEKLVNQVNESKN